MYQQDIDGVLGFVKYWTLFQRKTSKSTLHHVWRGKKKICNFSCSRVSNLAFSRAVSKIITTKQAKFNNLNNLYRYFSIIYG